MPAYQNSEPTADNMGAEDESDAPETLYISKDSLGTYDCQPGDILTFEVVSVDEDTGEIGMDFQSEASPDESDEEEEADIAALRAVR